MMAEWHPASAHSMGLVAAVIVPSCQPKSTDETSPVPRRWLAASLVPLLIVGFTFLVRGSTLSLSWIDWDEGVYIVMAQQWLAGHLPYVTVWDQHPPGLPALLALVQAIIPDPVLGARLAASLAIAVVAVCIQQFCRRHANRASTGIIAATLYIICMSRFTGLSANTETFNNALVTAAAFLLFEAAPRRDAGWPRAISAALLLGIGLQIKFVILPEAVLLCLAYLATSYRVTRNARATLLSALSLMLAGLLPTAIAVAYFWQRGLLGALLAANVSANVDYVTIFPSLRATFEGSTSGLLPIAGPILLLVYAAMRGAWRSGWSRHGPVASWLLLWTVAAICDVTMPMKFYSHYFAALYPPLCIAGALALDRFVPQGRTAYFAGIAVLFLAALPLWGVGAARALRLSTSDPTRDVAEFLRRANAGDDDVFVYNYQPVIYALAHVRPPTPYMLKVELSVFSRSSHVDGAAEIRRVMDARPRFVVVAQDLLELPNADALDRLMTARLGSYRMVREIGERNGGRVRVYER